MAEFESPGGFVFGVQGWDWGTPRAKSITFFIDGSCKVCDQHGRPIRGAVIDNKEVVFALSTHAQVIAALTAEQVDWKKLVYAGWPQLPYAQLKGLDPLPPTPLDELKKIRDPQLRKDALRLRREYDDIRNKEMAAVDEE